MYFRLHGSPVMYHSSYDALFLDGIARAVKTYTRVPVWCIFDNTARGAATVNAIELIDALSLCERHSGAIAAPPMSRAKASR